MRQGKAIGVVSQTDMVLARQGRTPEQARTMLARAIMTPGCATCDADMLLSDAVSLLTAGACIAWWSPKTSSRSASSR
jgi:crotonyl-CoA carboxylase/reductase